MEINTKFSVGDTVWFMEDNRPVSDTIMGIDIKVYDSLKHISYHLKERADKMGESSGMYASKNELLASL